MATFARFRKKSFARNERIRLFQKKVNARQSVIISLAALILPVTLWGFLLFSPNTELPGLNESVENTGMRMIGLLLLSMFLFLIAYMLLKELWQSKVFRSVKKLTEKDLIQELLEDIEVIDDEVEEIIYSSVFVEPRIPEKFFSADLLLILIRYFEKGQATFMKEAVFSLNLELKNTDHYENILPKETLLEREKLYLLDKERQLKRKIEMSGE